MFHVVFLLVLWATASQPTFASAAQPEQLYYRSKAVNPKCLWEACSRKIPMVVVVGIAPCQTRAVQTLSGDAGTVKGTIGSTTIRKIRDAAVVDGNDPYDINYRSGHPLLLSLGQYSTSGDSSKKILTLSWDTAVVEAIDVSRDGNYPCVINDRFRPTAASFPRPIQHVRDSEVVYHKYRSRDCSKKIRRAEDSGPGPGPRQTAGSTATRTLSEDAAVVEAIGVWPSGNHHIDIKSDRFWPSVGSAARPVPLRHQGSVIVNPRPKCTSKKIKMVTLINVGPAGSPGLNRPLRGDAVADNYPVDINPNRFWQVRQTHDRNACFGPKA